MRRKDDNMKKLGSETRVTLCMLFHTISRKCAFSSCAIFKTSCAASLTSLQLGVYSKGSTSERMPLPKSLNLPALTTLYLENFSFSGNDIDGYVEPLSGWIVWSFTIVPSVMMQLSSAYQVGPYTYALIPCRKYSRRSGISYII